MYDVRQFGYDWGGDLGAAVNAAIAAAPPVRPTVGGWANAHVVTRILIPTSTNGLIHQVATQIRIPINRAVEIVCEDGTASALLEWVGLGGYMAAILNGQRTVKFRNLSFWKGGIEIGETGTTAGVRKDWGIYDSHIIEAPEWGIVTRAQSIIGGTIDNITFRANGQGSTDGGDIYFAHEQSDVNVIRDCDFLTCHGTNLRLRTSGIHVTDCDFEQRPAGHTGKPYVHLDVGSNANVGQKAAGDIHFSRCRFGNERYHPRAAVVIGPNDGTIAANLMNDVTFHQCRFRGANTAVPSESNGYTVFELNAPPQQVRLTDCEIFPSYGWFALENYLHDSVAGAAAKAYGNKVDTQLSMVNGVFDHGGFGWALGEGTSRHIRPTTEHATTENTLQEAHDLSRWALFGGATGASVADPVGGNCAYEVTQTNGNDGIQNSATITRLGEPMVLSFWGRESTNPGVQGNGTVVRVQVGTGHGNGIEREWRFRMSTRWERYWVQIPEMNVAAPLVQFMVGDEVGAGGAVARLWGPQLEYGWGPPSPLLYATVDNQLHAPRQHQGLVVGAAQHGYGPTAPTFGRYNVGDVVWNTAPTAGGVMGWVCVAAGAPGTWKTFGAIAP